jgi:hypothetical protein
MAYSKPLINAMYTYFINHGMYDYRRGWLKGTCPYCGKNDKFGVNLYLGKSNCFVCGNHGAPIWVIGHMEDIEEYQDILKLLKSDVILEYQEPLLEQLEEKPVIMPPGFVLLMEDRGKMATMMRNHIRNRGLDPKVLSSKGFGYCTEGKLFGYLIMPFYVNGRLVYYHTRNVLGQGPKFDNPNIEEFGIGKSSVLYNIDALWMYRTIYLVESVMNAETIGERGVATGGKKISDHQISLIRNSPVENVIIMLDPDAKADIVKVGFKLIETKGIKVCLFPEGKDVNDLGRKVALRYAYKSRYLNYSGLMKLKNKLHYDEGPQSAY